MSIRFSRSLWLLLLLSLFVLPAAAQSLTVTDATPDVNGDGLLTQDEFSQIKLIGAALDTVNSVVLEHVDTSATCSLAISSQSADELLLDTTSCSFYPGTGTFRVTAHNGLESDSEQFTLTSGGPRDNHFVVGE